MRDKKKIRRYIQSRILHWMVELDLATWEYSLKSKRLPEVGGEIIWAKVNVLWEYKTLEITFNIPMMAEEGVTKQFIDKTLAHELYHAKVARGWDIVRMLSDLVGTMILKQEEREVAELELMPLTRRAFSK